MVTPYGFLMEFCNGTERFLFLPRGLLVRLPIVLIPICRGRDFRLVEHGAIFISCQMYAYSSKVAGTTSTSYWLLSLKFAFKL